MTRPRTPLGYWVPTSGAHGGHTLVFTTDPERPWFCEPCEVQLSAEDLRREEVVLP